MRLIDADHFIAEMEKLYRDVEWEDREVHFSLNDLRRNIENLPSIQSEIIRCKDCKFYSPMNRETKTGICNLTLHQNFGDDWFCAGAEKRKYEK